MAKGLYMWSVREVWWGRRGQMFLLQGQLHVPWLVKWLCMRKPSIWCPGHFCTVWGANQNFKRRSACLPPIIKIN